MHANIRNLGLVFSLFLIALPARADTRLIFPRVIFQNGIFSGIAISNPTGSPATITLTAYNLDGTTLTTAGTSNPVTPPTQVASGGQYLNLASQVFDPTGVLGGSTPKYFWVEVTSATSGLAGFYIEGNNPTTYQYGGDLGTFGTDLYLPAVNNTGTSVTEISLVNADTSAGGGDANVTVDFLRSDGTIVPGGTKAVVIPKAASIQGPLSSITAFNLSFTDVTALRVRSDRPVLCYGIVRPQSGLTPIALPAEDVTTPAKTLYFPQLADGGDWNTSLGIVNLDFSSQALVNISAYDKNGNLFVDPTITNPKSVAIPAGGQLQKTFKELFPFTDSSYKEGWLKVDAATPSINGFVQYGSGSNRALVIAQLNSYQLSMFSHQAQAPTSPGEPSYFTGLAVLNPGTLAANVEIFSLSPAGNTVGRIQTVLKPGQRTSQLLFQLVTESAGTNGGSVFVRSDRPVFTTELFAINKQNSVIALANVPPQQVTATFSPSSTLAAIKPVPQLAVVETGKPQQFSTPGVTGINWSVVGPPGIDVGSISSGGLYTAPAKAPAPRTLTIQASASTGNNSGASSIDVVQREQLTGGLTLVTAVAYMENLARFFVAEQKLATSAPSIGYAAGTYNTQISEVKKSGGTTSNVPFVAISGDTISKMLPYNDGTSDYLLLAGKDTGKIYRLDTSGNPPKTVVSGLNQPTSMALDPTTGNLLVAESGAGQITVITAAQIAAASAPSATAQAPGTIQPLRSLLVPNIQGIAVDKCTGTVYVTDTDGNLIEYQGSSKRTVETGLTRPTQLLAIYREGFSCAPALAIVIVEATKISLSYPKAPIARATLLDNTQNINDITFFPKGNPFTSGGEPSLGLAQASSTPSQGQIADILLGGVYQYIPPILITRGGLLIGTGSNEDPIGDTFDYLGTYTSQYGYSVPDITSVTGSVQGTQSVITIKFAAPVSLGGGFQPSGMPVDGVWAYIYIHTKAATGALSQFPISFGEYFPFGNPGAFTFDSILYVFEGQGAFVSFSGQYADVKASAIGNTLTLSVPITALDLKGATAIVLVGNPLEITDVAPNNGLLSFVP